MFLHFRSRHGPHTSAPLGNVILKRALYRISTTCRRMSLLFRLLLLWLQSPTVLLLVLVLTGADMSSLASVSSQPL